jgi:hypothetical protein
VSTCRLAVHSSLPLSSILCHLSPWSFCAPVPPCPIVQCISPSLSLPPPPLPKGTEKGGRDKRGGMLRMGLEGMTVESRVFHCRKSNSKGGRTWLQLIRSCALHSPSVQFQDGGREVTCGGPMLEVRESEVRTFRRSPKTRDRSNLVEAWSILNLRIQVD